MSARRRNRLRTFSLRSFLILVLLTGLSIGLWVSTVQPMQRQWEAVDRFLAAEAEIETRPSNLPWWVKQFFPADRSDDITMIKFPPHFRDLGEAIKGLKDLPHLERLYLPRQRITDKDIAEFAKLKKLKRLALWGNRLTDASVQQLASLPNLEVVDLKKNEFSWRALLPFKDRPNVEVRHDFVFDEATSAELEEMVQLNNQTEWITLTEYAPEVVAKAFQWLPNLKSFTHQDWSKFDQDDWQAVVDAGSDRKFRFSFSGDTPFDSPGWSAAAQVLRPREVRCRLAPIHQIYFRNGKSDYYLKSSGDWSEFEAPEFFSDAHTLTFAESSFADLKFLRGAKKLSRLELLNCPNLTEISPVPRSVRSIEIFRCDSLKRVTGWESDELRTLKILCCSQLEHLDDIEKFTRLDWLKLKKLPKLNSLELLEGLNELESLALADVGSKLFLSSLPTLERLHKLDLSGSDSLRNLDGMKKLPALKHLALHDCPKLEQIAGVRVNDQLRSVSLDKTPALKSLEGLSGMSNMRSLTITSSGLQSLNGLDGFESLEELTISKFNRLVNCGEKLTLPNLKKMRIVGCELVTDVSGLVAPKLSDLDIGGNSEIAFADVGNLPKFKKLERLSLRACPGLRSLKSLSGDSEIIEASFHECPNLVDFTGAAFESLTVSKDYLDWYRETKEDQPFDLTPLKDLKKLKVRLDNISGFKGLESLTQLQELDLNTWQLDVNSLRLPDSIQALRIEYDRTAQELTILKRLPNLRILELAKSKVETLDCLNQIERLNLFWCEVPDSICGLGNLSEVELAFGSSKSVATDLSFLSAAPNLKALSIRAYRNLRGFDFLKQAKQLKHLYLEWKCAVINGKRPVPADISAIEHCKNLDTLILDSCELPGIEAVGKLDIRDLRLGEFHFPNLELVSQMENLEVLKLNDCKQLKSLDGIGPKPKLSSLYIEQLNAQYSKEKKTLPAYDYHDKRYRESPRSKWWTVAPSGITP